MYHPFSFIPSLVHNKFVPMSKSIGVQETYEKVQLPFSYNLSLEIFWKLNSKLAQFPTPVQIGRDFQVHYHAGLHTTREERGEVPYQGDSAHEGPKQVAGV